MVVKININLFSYFYQYLMNQFDGFTLILEKNQTEQHWS